MNGLLALAGLAAIGIATRGSKIVPWSDYQFAIARRQIDEAKKLGFDTSSMEDRYAEQMGMKLIREMDAVPSGSSASWDETFKASDEADLLWRRRRR